MSAKSQKTKVIQTRLPEDLVNEATKILDYIGLSATDAVRILFKNIVNTGGLPFEMTKRNSQNPPILNFSPEKTAQIEQILADYYTGELETSTLSTSEEIKNYFTKLNLE